MKKILFLICFLFLVFTIKSQNYLTVIGGIDSYLTPYKYENLKFSKTIAPTVAVDLGHNFSPYCGVRAEIRTGNTIFTKYSDTPYLMGFADVYTNLLNVIGGNRNRNVELILFGGIGDVQTFNNLSKNIKSDNNFALRTGIACDIYIWNSNKCSLFFEPCFTINHYAMGKLVQDYIINLSIGYCFNL